MPKDSKTIPAARPFWKKKRYIIPAALILIFVLYKIFHHKASPYQLVPVTQGSITETVSVTGNTTPVQSVSLGFENSGTISNVAYAVGQHVSAGTVIASLDASNLSAQLQEAQANVAAAQAKLGGLQAGAQPQDIAASQASVAKAQQDLANMYASISNTTTSAYAAANDAVRTQLNGFFTNPDTSSPQLTFQSLDSVDVTSSQLLRAGSTTALANLATDLSAASSTSSNADLSRLASDGLTDLKQIQSMLMAVSNALNASVGLSASQVTAYKASVTAATNEVNSSVTTLTTLTQNIASETLTVAQLQAQLAVTQAGSTSSDIAAQEAAVQEAQATVASAEANLGNAEIVAPMSGVITQQDAKVGQVASPGTPLVSIISDGNFEVDALVPETDIGKVAVGNPVNMTFDAFQGQTFTGKVFYIDPAQTITSGVVDYLVKVSFDTPSAAMKSGLTANLDIQTKTDANALILPQYAVLVNDSGASVETLDAKGAVVTTPVTLGIQDENGNVEVLTGVTLGEKVVNIGLKTAS